jgi:lipid-binding SYLF domain-containing protein
MNRSMLIVALLLAAGCSTESDTPDAHVLLHSDVTDTLKRMNSEDPSLDALLKSAAGYVVFPTVGKAGFLVGAAYGQGEVYSQGNFVGYAEITQLTGGAQIGGQTYSEVIAFQTPTAVAFFESGQFALNANVSSVVLKYGAASTNQYDSGSEVFIEPTAGIMAEASVGGQHFWFQAK